MSRKQSCGCEIDSPMSGTVCLNHDIIYCPLHATAPEMLDALRDLVVHAENGREKDVMRDASVVRARAVIKKVDGTQG